MEEELIKIITSYGYPYKKIEGNILTIIYDLFKNNSIYEITKHQYDDSDVYLYIGIYCNINKSNDVILFYNKSTEMGNVIAPCLLGYYYWGIKDYDNMFHYYQMGIDNCNIDAVIGLGTYYEENDDLINAEKIYLTSMDKNNKDIMDHLANLYYKKGNNNKMIEYFIMAMEHGDSEAFFEILNYFHKNIDIVNYIKSYDRIFFSEKIIDKYNKLFIEFNKHTKEINCVIYITSECVNCIKNTKCLYRSCGHSSCQDCYYDKCRICSHNSKMICNYKKCTICHDSA